MEGRPSFVSSRNFAKDILPVPNIVALYDRPRNTIRRDATHVFGGMFGWNTPEEMDRALRAESSRGEEATATPDSATPADSTPAGPSHRCIKKPAKRSKRRGFAPLIDMGASILNMRFQELLRRQHQPEEKEVSTPALVPSKRPPEPVAETIISPVESPASKQAKISLPSGDAPTKRLRLTINTTPRIDTPVSTTLPSSFLQMPSPPDTSNDSKTSSNGSKIHAEDSSFAICSASTPKDVLALTGFGESTLNVDFHDFESDSDSESSSESTSDLDSDSAGLSSSSSTRSMTKNLGKGKVSASQSMARSRKNTKSTSPAPTPTPPPLPPSRPSTPPRKKRQTHKPGWVGWVQTEESPDHSRLIRLDDAPVILGRRTRSGKEFHDPPPLPPSRRKSIKGGQPTPSQQTLEQPRPNPRVSRRRHTGEKSKQQTAWQEAQKRAANGDKVENSDNTAGVAQPDDIKDEDPGVFDISKDLYRTASPKRTDGELPVVATFGNQTTTALPAVPLSASAPSSAPQASSSIAQGEDPSVRTDLISPATISIASPASGPTLTHPDSVITPASSRLNGSNVKDRTGKDLARSLVNTISPTKVVPPKSQTGAYVSEHVRGLSPPASTAALAAQTHRNPAISAFKEPTTSLKAVSDVSASKKPFTSAKNDVSKNFSIELKSRSSTSNSAPKVQLLCKSDISAGEVSAVLAKIPRSESPSPPEKGKRPIPTTSANSNIVPSTSSAKTVVTTKIKPLELSTASSTRKSGLPTDRRDHLFSKSGKNAEPAHGLSILGKRKEHVPQASSSHFKKRKLSRKLVVSSSDDSDSGNRFVTAGFSINPFERRAKQMELTRKGLSGEAYKHEMEKWIDAKRAEWRSARDKRRDDRKRESEKSGSDGKLNNFFRQPKPIESASTVVADSTSKTSKDAPKTSRDVRISELPRIAKAPKEASQSDHAGHSPKAQKSVSKIWNGDWGMDISRVSVTGSSADFKHKPRKLLHKRDSDATGAKDPTAGQTSTASNAAPLRNRA